MSAATCEAVQNMNLISTISSEESHFNHAWLNRVKADIGVDLIGVLAVEPDSHPDFIEGVKVFMPKARAAVIIMNELAS